MNLLFTPRYAVLFGLVLLLASAGPTEAQSLVNASSKDVPALLMISPRESTALDGQIAASQHRLASSMSPGPELERLGWLYIAKARASSDPGFFTLAGIAADALEQKFNLPQEAWLLRGHVLHSHHRFAETEEIARRLIGARGGAPDFALLGDALYDEGRVDEAAGAYQRMVDLKPGLDSYSRAANIRWIKGDLHGAVQLQLLAVRSGGPGDAGALAWSLCRLGMLVWQQGDSVAATRCADRALKLVPEFEPALLLQGRLLLAAGRPVDALMPLARAIAILPLPEPRWVYAEALRAAGRTREAVAMENLLVREGITEDPRTVALFLATHGRDPAMALKLAQAELAVRADVMTHAADALALSATGRIQDALIQGRAALAEGTVDGRLLLYAGRVAAMAGQPEAVGLLARAGRFTAQLLPSERSLLHDSLLLSEADSRPKDGTNPPPQHKTS